MRLHRRHHRHRADGHGAADGGDDTDLTLLENTVGFWITAQASSFAWTYIDTAPTPLPALFSYLCASPLFQEPQHSFAEYTCMFIKLLFCGPPGCGKTLCAEIFAHEAQLLLFVANMDTLVSSASRRAFTQCVFTKPSQMLRHRSPRLVRSSG